MKIIRLIICSLLVSIVSMNLVFAESSEKMFQKNSVEDVIQISLENNLELEIARRELLKAEITYRDDIRGIKSSEENLKYFPLRDPITGAAIPDATINRAMIKNGAARRGVELAYNVAKWNVEMVENKVKYNTVKEYYGYLQAMKELEISTSTLELSKKHYDQGKLRFNLGLMSKQQLISLELGVIQSQSSVDIALMRLNIQDMSFKRAVGIEFDKKIELTDIVNKEEYDEIDLNESIKLAFEKNGSLKIFTENYEISKLTLAAVYARYPEITYRYREQAAEVAKAELNFQNVKNSVEMGVRSSYISLITAEKQIATFELAVKQAEEALRIAELSFQLGQNTATDVTQANINLMNAKKSLAQQIHAFNMALLDFEYSTGIGK